MVSPLLLSQLGTSETSRLASYLRTSFLSQTAGAMPSQIPGSMRLEDVIACDWYGLLLSEAASNIRRTSWSATDYRNYIQGKSPCSTGRNEAFEQDLLRKFPPINEIVETMTDPCVVLDKDDQILLWYLPRLINRQDNQLMWQSVALMQPHMDIRTNSPSWRNDAQHFMPVKQCQIRPGTFSVAPFWFQQAHSTVNQLEVSAKLRTGEGLAWIQDTHRMSALLGALLSVAHPAQYQAGMDCLQAVASNPLLVEKSLELKVILETWSAPFTGVSVMNNRKTPYHRDNGGFYETFDLMASVGPYTKAVMTLKSLGISLDYPSGTVVLLATRLISHAAQADGERAVFSYYLKHPVVRRLTDAKVTFAYFPDLI